MIAMYEADPTIERVVVHRLKGAKKPNGTRETVFIHGFALTAHYFRHNYASVPYNAGVDILSAQRFMGHADPSVTVAVYSHLAKDKEDENADLVHDAISGKVASKLPENKKVNRSTKSKTPKT